MDALLAHSVDHFAAPFVRKTIRFVQSPDLLECQSRISAAAVLDSPDALPINDILRAITPVESELLRLLLLVPDQQLRVAEERSGDSEALLHPE